MQDKMNNWLFGCDICQDVCPWNRFSKPNSEPAFTPIAQILNLTSRQWEEMTEETFRKVFKNSPLKRAKFQGIQRNLKALRQ
jgi:epoxyqueuosine reductase